MSASARANAVARQQQQQQAQQQPRPQAPRQGGQQPPTPQQMQQYQQLMQQQQRMSQQQPQMQPQPQMQQQQPSQMQQQPSQMQTTKLSISDAIALITLRLGSVENYIQKQQQSEGTSTPASFDNSTLNSIIARLNVLESSHKNITTKLTSAQPSSVSHTIASVSSAPVYSDDLKSEVDYLKSELAQTKDLLMTLQSFTMQTNQKLVDAVFSSDNEPNAHSFISMAAMNPFFSLNTANKSSVEVIELDEHSLLPNLKDLIQEELANQES